jgi:LacI family transcriptional regulator
MSPKRARIKDIAELSGVSIGTVDRVLHNRGEVAEKTREKVMKITKDLNYSPNLIARALKLKKRFRIVSLLPEPTEESAFWKKHPEGMLKAMNELDPFPIVLNQINFDLIDEKDFEKKSQKVLSLSPDGVILAPIFKTQATAFCNKMTTKHIPFVFIDGFLEDAGFLSYTGEDIFQSGRVSGQLVDMITPVTKDILILNITRNIMNVQHLNKRTQGFLSYFPDSGKNRGGLISMSIIDPIPENMRKELRKVLAKNPDIGSIFITGSKSYMVADYLESEGIKSINLVGYDLHERNVRHLRSGNIRFLLGQRPDEQTYKGIKKLFDFLSMDKVPEKMEYLPVDVVTSENVQFFLNNKK